MTNVNLSKVRLNDALRCGESVAFTESQAQSDRASSWLWSVANNPKSSKSGVQDYKPLLTTHPYDSIPYPPKDLILHPYTITLGRAEARALESARRPVGPVGSLLGLGEC